jgi:hypothetical protein
MRNLIMIAAIAAALFGSVAARAQSDREGSTEAGTSYGGYGGYYGGAYGRYGGYGVRHHYYRR